MPSFLKSANPYTAILLFVYTFLCRLYALGHPQLMTPALKGEVVYNWLVQVFTSITFHSAFFMTLVALISTYLQALYINFIANQAKLTLRSGYVLAFTFLTLMSLNTGFSYLCKTHFMIWFLLYALQCIFQFPKTTSARKFIFNAAFALSCMALIQFSGWFGLLLFVSALLLLRPYSVNEWAIGLLGILTPIYFLICILFLKDQLSSLRFYPALGFQMPKQIQDPTYLIIIVFAVIILLLLGAYNLNSSFNTMTIETRRKWIIINTAIFVCLLIALFSNNSQPDAWMIVLTPITFISAYAILFPRKRWLNNFTFYFMIAVVIFAQNFSTISKHL